MKKLALLIFGIFLAGCTQSSSPNTVTPSTPPSSTNSTITQPIDSQTPITVTNRYIPFSSQALADTVNTRRVLFFYANWCPTCIPVDKSFTENTSFIPSDTTVVRVNYNDTETDQEEKDLAKKYGITYQHTFVQIDEQGEAVTKWNGGSAEELFEKIITAK